MAIRGRHALKSDYPPLDIMLAEDGSFSLVLQEREGCMPP